MKKIFHIALAVIVVAIWTNNVKGAAQLYSMIYGNGYTNPATTLAGYLATADGGVVAVLGSPAPTAAGKGLVTTDATHAVWSPVPVGSGTVNYIPEWTPDGSHLGNATMSESGASLYRQLAAGNLVYLDLFNSITATAPKVYLRHSLGGTIGSLIATTTNTIEGTILWEGVSSSPGFALGAAIQAVQFGAAGASYVPTQLTLATSSASAYNGTQLVLNPDNSVSMSGPVSASNIVATPTANDIPKANASHLLDPGWLPVATTSVAGANVSGLQAIAGTTGVISQVPCIGTYTSITTNTGTSTSVSLCTIPIGSASAPSLLQLSTTTPLANAASGSAGTGITAARGDHVHPISSSGLIYYATSGAGFSTTMPGATTELTQAMAAGSATINLATSSGTPGLSVWPAGTLNFDVWAYMSSMGSGCTYKLNDFQVAAVRGASTAYQTGGGSAGATLTGSYAEYKYTVPVSQLTGTATDIFKTPLIVTSTNSPTCNAATLHIGVGTGQATNVGTLFYQVPSLDGVEYQANKDQANGYCPLDSNVLVPVANLPAVTESTAGAMSAADKTKLDGIAAGATVDDHKVAAYSGATPNYLTSAMTSPNTTISLDVDTSNHVTIDVNAIAESQVTNLVSDLAGKINTSSIGVANGVAGLGTDSKVAAGNLPSSTTTAPGIVQLSTQARISTTTSTATASSTAVKAMPEDAKVILPPFSPPIVAGSGISTGTGIGTNTAVTVAVDTSVVCTTDTSETNGAVALWRSSGGPPKLTSGPNYSRSPFPNVLVQAQSDGYIDNRFLGLAPSVPQVGMVAVVGTVSSWSTGTTTNTSTSLTYAWPPTGATTISYGGPSAETFGASSAAGVSTSVTRADHVHALPALPSASTSVAGICQYGTGSTNCMQGNTTHLSGDVATSSVGVANGVCPLNGSSVVSQTYLPYGDTSNYGMMKMSGATPQPLGVATPGTLGLPSDAGHVHPLPSNSIRNIYSAQLSGLVTVSSNSWTSVLSVSTSGNGGRIIAYGAVTLTSTTASRCDARIVLDNYASGDGPALKGVTDSNVQASLSPIFTTTFSAGSHTVNLQVLNFNSINCQATIGYQNENFGSLIVQEFTN